MKAILATNRFVGGFILFFFGLRWMRGVDAELSAMDAVWPVTGIAHIPTALMLACGLALMISAAFARNPRYLPPHPNRKHHE